MQMRAVRAAHPTRLVRWPWEPSHEQRQAVRLPHAHPQAAEPGQDETLREVCRRDRRADPLRHPRSRATGALGAACQQHLRGQPVDGVPGLLPAGESRADRGPGTLGLLRPRAGPAPAAGARHQRPRGADQRGRRQRTGVLGARLTEGPEHRAVRLGLPQPRPVPPRPPGTLNEPRGARAVAARGDRRHDRGQRRPAPADRPALHGQRGDAATGGAGDQHRRHGGAQPVPAVRDPPRRPGGHRGAGVLRHPAGTRAPGTQGGGDPRAPARGHRPGQPGGQPPAVADQGLLVHEQPAEPARREHGRGPQACAVRAAAAPSGAADRGRRLRRAVLRQPAAQAGEELRPRGPGDALRLVLQVPGAGLPGRLGGRRALGRADPQAQADDHHFAVGAGAGGHRRLPAARRLRPPPAPPAPCAGEPAGVDAGLGGAALPGQHAGDPAERRLFPVVRIPRAGRLAQAVPAGPGPGHQPGAGTDLLSHPALRQLRAAQLRPSVGRAERARHGSARAHHRLVLIRSNSWGAFCPNANGPHKAGR
ncbi:hypothetical protein OF001_U60048 [Pseudomonas sp. OF001]|nr:hypothetical protein OF001_U60048 [Pseudomonas sp. OF001]